MYNFILVVVIMFGNHPASKSNLQCTEVVGYGSDDGTPTPDVIMGADSGGRVVIEGPPMDYHCRAFNAVASWTGTISVDKDHLKITVELRED